MEKISRYEVMRPELEEKLGSGGVKEIVKRDTKPYEIQLKEINGFNERYISKRSI